MSTAMRLLTDSEIESLEQELAANSALVQKGEVSLEDGLDTVQRIKDQMSTRGMNLTPDQISDTRKRVWSDANGQESYIKGLLFEEGKGKPAKFQPGDVIDMETIKIINRVSVEINKMTNNPDSEAATRDLIATVNDYGKLVHSEHHEYKRLWKKYNDKLISNYMEYAKGNRRFPNRDKAFSNKLLEIQKSGKFSNANALQAALTLLEPTIPQA